MLFIALLSVPTVNIAISQQPQQNRARMQFQGHYVTYHCSSYRRKPKLVFCAHIVHKETEVDTTNLGLMLNFTRPLQLLFQVCGDITLNLDNVSSFYFITSVKLIIKCSFNRSFSMSSLIIVHFSCLKNFSSNYYQACSLLTCVVMSN